MAMFLLMKNFRLKNVKSRSFALPSSVWRTLRSSMNTAVGNERSLRSAFARHGQACTYIISNHLRASPDPLYRKEWLQYANWEVSVLYRTFFSPFKYKHVP